VDGQGVAGDAVVCGIAPDGAAAPAVFSDLPPGSYVVTPAGAAAGFGLAVPESATLGAGQDLSVTVTAPAAVRAGQDPNPARATILVLALDAATGAPALGSCFVLTPGDGSAPMAGCVVAGAGGAAPPPLSFSVLAPGFYTVTALTLPSDTVARPASQATSVQPGQTFTLVIGIMPE